jgi:hypothetical protein
LLDEFSQLLLMVFHELFTTLFRDVYQACDAATSLDLPS